MRKSKEELLDIYVKDLLTGAKLEGDELIKLCIVWKTFYNEIKKDVGNCSVKKLKSVAYTFLRFIVEFETVCVTAYKPLSGSQSTAKDIISMYSRRSSAINLKNIQ